MSFDFSLIPQEPVDWDQFLVDEDLNSKVIALEPTSPAFSDSQTGTPQSTESEQSQSLDVTAGDFDFDFSFNAGFEAGIMHSPEDVPKTIQSSLPGPETSDLKADIPAWQGAFGDFTGLGNDAAVELGLTNLLGKLAGETQPSPPQPIASTPTASPSLDQAYAALGWASPTVEPAAISLPPSPSLKRKDSEPSVDAVPAAKRPRGRPPKSRSIDVAPMSARRQSTTSSSPLRQTVSFDDVDSETGSPKTTASGKLSTARPKSVVPEKYFKDGSAQAILGMTVEQIQAFPTFEELLKQVEPVKRAAAAEFGARIADNRDKAKDAAKKSREERKAKIDTLERTVSDLEGKIEGLQGVLLGLVARGVISETDVAAHLA